MWTVLEFLDGYSMCDKVDHLNMNKQLNLHNKNGAANGKPSELMSINYFYPYDSVR